MRTVLLFFIVLTCNSLFSQPIEMFQQFNGRYNYTAFGNTLNEYENNGPNANCTFLTQSSANYNLPSSQSLVSALLYWSGIGSGDFDVSLNGDNVSAERTFLHAFNGQDYFAAYTDVTSLVMSTGNGSYTLSDLDLSSIQSNYCGTDYAGWAVIVIYEDPSLPLNQIGVFDGFESVSATNDTLNILLENIDVVNVNQAKIGFLAWEGEPTIANNETLRINGNILSNPPLNPADNAFNSTNSFTGSSVMHNMDLDFYNIESFIDVGDISMNIDVTSNQDMVLFNNIVTVINSELPDGTLRVENAGILCYVDELEVSYIVNNVNSTKILPANTPIAFYAEGILVGQSANVADIAIGENESGFITLQIPSGLPLTFTLTVVVDDDSTGTGILSETDESNNSFEISVTIGTAPNTSPVTDYILLDTNNDGFEIFDLTSKSSEILNGQTGIDLRFFESQADANMGVNEIANATSYINISNPQTIYVRLDNQNDNCFAITSFVLIAEENLAIEENVFNDLQLVPNPASDNLSIQSQFLTSESTVTIFNLQGQQVISEIMTPQNGIITVSVSGIANGMYLLKLTSEGNSITRKLIKN